MSDGATKVIFYVEGGDMIGEYLMYTPPAVGDDITWDELTYTVVRRNFDAYDAFIRITVRRKEQG